jgi:hypothetical protein
MKLLVLIGAIAAALAPGGGTLFRTRSEGMAPTIPVGSRVVASVGA